MNPSLSRCIEQLRGWKTLVVDENTRLDELALRKVLDAAEESIELRRLLECARASVGFEACSDAPGPDMRDLIADIDAALGCK